jgi:NAD(P)-dependent dehydrogenase (short-subunit alcohol dehydrogenase family)
MPVKWECDAMTLKGKVALVTGAGRGVGRAHALMLAKVGARVMVNDYGGSAWGEGTDLAPAQEVAAEIAARGGEAAADTTDVSIWADAQELIDRTVERFGRLDILVNNAGISRPTRFGELSEGVWDRIVDINAKSMAALIDAAARHWQNAGPSAERAIVCTASCSGSNPHFPLGVYGISKQAVLAIAQVAAQELAPLGVRVNALGPTARTRMVLAAMHGYRDNIDEVMPHDTDYDLFDPDHVARVMLYLVSPQCRFTGRFFAVRADDVYLYDSWTAAHHVANGRTAWTQEALAAALADLPVHQPTRTVGPMGGHDVPFPGEGVLSQLADAGR